MTTVDLDFWWLIFPLFGVVMAIVGCAREGGADAATARDLRAGLERDQ